MKTISGSAAVEIAGSFLFLPFENFLKKFGLSVITNNYQSFSNGEDRKIIDIKRDDFSLKILPLICYEIIYSGKLSKNKDFKWIHRVI